MMNESPAPEDYEQNGPISSGSVMANNVLGIENEGYNDIALTGDKFVTLDWHPDTSGKPQRATVAEAEAFAHDLAYQRSKHEREIIKKQDEIVAKEEEDIEHEIEE